MRAAFVCCAKLRAARLCVNPGGTGGCTSSISAAVVAASAGDIVQVAAGTYKEEVVISTGPCSAHPEARHRELAISTTGDISGPAKRLHG